MSHSSYAENLSNIRRSLSKFTHSSIFDAARKRLGFKGTAQEKMMMMPWVTMFLLKQSFMNNSGCRKISIKEFNVLLNKIYHLQNDAIGSESLELRLSLRALMIQQIWYQNSFESKVLKISRQKLLIAHNSKYNDSFIACTGISINAFLDISLYLIVLSKNNNSELFEISVSQLIYDLGGSYTVKDICSYFKLLAIHADSLPAYIKNNYHLEDDPVSEFFQETPFKYKPIIFQDRQLYIYNTNIFSSSVSLLVPTLLKKHLKGFKDTFGLVFQDYVESLISMSGLRYLNEDELCDLYRGLSGNGKCPDFLIFSDDESVTLVECKAIEPSDIVKALAIPSQLKSNLESSYIHAIKQGFSCSAALARSSDYKNKKIRLVVVLHEDHYILDGEFISSYIDTSLVPQMKLLYPAANLSINDIMFIPVGDFERLMVANSEGKINFNQFVQFAMDSQKSPVTRRMQFSQFLDELKPPVALTTVQLMQSIGADFDKIENQVINSNKDWKSLPLRKYLEACERVSEVIFK